VVYLCCALLFVFCCVFSPVCCRYRCICLAKTLLQNYVLRFECDVKLLTQSLIGFWSCYLSLNWVRVGQKWAIFLRYTMCEPPLNTELVAASLVCGLSAFSISSLYYFKKKQICISIVFITLLFREDFGMGCIFLRLVFLAPSQYITCHCRCSK